MAPGEAAQERAERGRRPHLLAEHVGRGGDPHPLGVVDAVAAREGRVHERHRLEPHVGPARGVAEVHELVEQLPQPEVLGQRRRGDHPGVGHGVVVIELHRHTVEAVA
jgi:hypothetical protein